MQLDGKAAIVGYHEYPHIRKFTGKRKFTLGQWADLTRLSLEDAGLVAGDINGLVCTEIRETAGFTPATIVEYLGQPVNFAERVDLGGANAVSMVWRAAVAIELGLADVVVCALPGQPIPTNPNPGPVDPRRYFQSSSANWGSPQAEFEIPYGNLAQNCGYAMIAQRYAAEYEYDPRAMAKLVVDQRRSGAMNPNAVFYDKPVTIDDVLNSKLIADPLRMLEIVMPVAGGAAVIVASEEIAKRCKHRPAWIKGFGEYLTMKTPTFSEDLCHSPVGPASTTAFEMANVARADIDACEIYDCYTITVLLTLEDAGFCGKGEGMEFIRSHDLSCLGDFPVNSHGGQLGVGQAGGAGGMTQVIEGARQIMGRAENRQIPRCEHVYVSGTGGIMSEQAALILAGE
ncbi:MAG: thiolase family protein [Gammaproteobacteria bacterium]|nr:thiolase family protein [Gammaproteobacteria bacterium]